MEIPNEADRELLRQIVLQTQQRGGSPPTLAELAVALGLQPSSRGNIQRQLARLRPTYVDWSSASRRSLRVTAAGLALLDVPEETPVLDQPVANIILPLLASGLTHMTEDLAAGKRLQAPYPEAWQRGLNILAAECLVRGVHPPQHSTEAIEWCHRPPSQWKVRFADPDPFLDEPLLEEEQPTALCYELAQGLPAGDAELELSEREMGRLRTEAETRRAQAGYVAVRSFLIEHPVVTRLELLHASFDPSRAPFRDVLQKFYEVAPADVVVDGQVLLCGHCGWTLVRRRGRLYCGDDRCRVLTDGFTRNTITQPVQTEVPLLRVNRAIRRYVVAPGRYEVRTAAAIESCGIAVELWPCYDAYDLRLVFADGDAWAVDVKDWRFPHLLARRLTPLRVELGCLWSRAFYAVPDARVRENPSYLTLLRSATARQPFNVVTLNELLTLAQDRKQDTDA